MVRYGDAYCHVYRCVLDIFQAPSNGDEKTTVNCEYKL